MKQKSANAEVLMFFAPFIVEFVRRDMNCLPFPCSVQMDHQKNCIYFCLILVFLALFAMYQADL